MRAITKALGSKMIMTVIVIGVLFAFSLCLREMRMNRVKAEIERLLRPGPDAIVSAGRELILNKEQYVPGDYPSRKRVFLLREAGLLKESIPQAIRDADPPFVMIDKQLLYIAGDLPRLTLVVFEDGASEYGSEKITNGLWVWIGDDHFRPARR